MSIEQRDTAADTPFGHHLVHHEDDVRTGEQLDYQQQLGTSTAQEVLGPCGGDEVPEDLGDRLEDDHYDDQQLEDRLIAGLVLTLGEV